MGDNRDVSGEGIPASLWAGSEPAPHWHSKIAQFFLYWRSIHPPNRLPGRVHLDPLAIPALLPGIWLLDVQHEPFRLRYRLAGTETVEAIGTEVTGRWMDEVNPQLTRDERYLDRYRRIVAQRLPSWRRGPPLLMSQRVRTIENLVVPLASDGNTVDMLAGLTVFDFDPGAEPHLLR
jgi:hypothetical protein